MNAPQAWHVPRAGKNGSKKLDAPLQRKLNYEDRFSQFHLLWKALLMAPTWGVLAIPLLGTFALLFVNNDSLDLSQSPGWQLCLGATMAACVVYFIDDLRKRIIYINKDEITYGLRRFQLEKMISMGVEYRSQHLMPNKIQLRFRDGRILKLHVSRLRHNEFESLLHFVETRLPQVQIDPVLLTLMRCRRAAGKAISDSGTSVEIRYNPRYILRELLDVFNKSRDEWSKYLPIVLALFTMPVWAIYVAALFMIPLSLKPALAGSSDPSKPPIVQGLTELSQHFWTLITTIIQNHAQEVSTAAGNPIIVALLSTISISLVISFLKLIMSPNRVLIQSDSVRLLFRLASYSLCVKNIPIESISKVTLHKPDELSDPSKWNIRFVLIDGKTVDLCLVAMSAEEKTRLTKSLQRLAPQIPIDAELLETLIPRQDRSYTELWLQSLSSAPERKSLDPLQPGQVLSNMRYQVIRCLGVGGQGTAYLCKDTALVESHLSDMVVLKESIFPVYADSDVRMQALERFEKEANLLRRLENPGIVALRDFFLEDHRGYLVMEHVDGNTIKQLVEAEGVLSELRVRELAVQMCDILNYLHANGVIHRDFTPDNLILSKNGQLKLIDFNVAQQMEAGSAGTIVGKQSYIPPEQFRGKATTQSDLYAMGATLHFMLTGEEPEPITQSSPLQNSALCSETLDQIVKDCTALQLSKRVTSAEEIKQRLLLRSQASTKAAELAETIEVRELAEADVLTVNLAQEEELLLENS